MRKGEKERGEIPVEPSSTKADVAHDEQEMDSRTVQVTDFLQDIADQAALWRAYKSAGNTEGMERASEDMKGHVEALKTFVAEHFDMVRPAFLAMFAISKNGALDVLGAALRSAKGQSIHNLQTLAESLIAEAAATDPKWQHSGKAVEFASRAMHEREQQLQQVVIDAVGDAATYEHWSDMCQRVDEQLIVVGVAAENVQYEGRQVLELVQRSLEKRYRATEENAKERERFLADLPEGFRSGEQWRRDSVRRSVGKKFSAVKNALAVDGQLPGFKSVQDALAHFPPDVLAPLCEQALTEGETWKFVTNEYDRERWDNPSNWTGDDRGRIARAVVEGGDNIDVLAFLNINEIPLSDLPYVRKQFFEVYRRLHSDKILANIEFFADEIRASGGPKDALAVLEKLPSVEEVTEGQLEMPSQEEVGSMDTSTLGRMFARNHTRLLSKITAIGAEHIPYFGLHGTKLATDLEQIRRVEPRHERRETSVTLQVATVLKKSHDPGLALVDFYDVVGGDSVYFQEKGSVLVLLMEDEQGPFSRPWGGDQRGQPQDWAKNGNWRGLPKDIVRYFRDDIHVPLTESELQLLQHLQRGRRPHSEKCQIGFSKEPGMRNSVDDYLVGSVNMCDTPFYLTELPMPTDGSDAINARAKLAEMLYVQFVADKILDLFMQRAVNKKTD